MFNKETEYALRALIYIQTQNFSGKRPGTGEIARETRTPHFFTAKILQRLAKAGFIQSAKGKGGGFFFDPEKPDVKLITLISAIEGEDTLTGCGMGYAECSAFNPCPLHKDYAPIRAQFFELVSTETIRSLAEKYAGSPSPGSILQANPAE